jgi:hypothetical protein
MPSALISDYYMDTIRLTNATIQRRFTTEESTSDDRPLAFQPT